jgi:hypothetical protein
MKKIAILIPTYRRFDDLINTLEKTYIDQRAKFIIVANLEDHQLDYLKVNYSSKAIIEDERKYGKLGGCKAYNLAYKIAKENGFDYAILFADDIIPFEKNWLDKLFKLFINKEGQFGVFSTDECHISHYGWNVILDCVIAHFFIIKINLVENLFLDKYTQYAIDFEIAVRLNEKQIPIFLLPIKLNHLRSGVHREFMESNMSKDIDILISDYPKYKQPLKDNKNLYLAKDYNTVKILSNLSKKDLVEWNQLNNEEIRFFLKLKNIVKSVIKRGLKLC